MTPISNQRIFLMESSRGFSARGTWLTSVDFESITCTLCPDHQRPGRRIGTLEVSFSDSASDDVLWTWYSECLMKVEIADHLANARLTGFELKIANVIDRSLQTSEIYSEFTITGWGGVARPESGITLIQKCSVCGMLIYSGVNNWPNLIDWEQWDGADFFMIWPLPRYIFTTARAVELMRQMRLTGVSFRPIEELDQLSGNLTPGRMSYWFSAKNLKRHRIPGDIL